MKDIEEIKEKLEHIIEYWNGGNESAVDAIEEAIETAKNSIALLDQHEKKVEKLVEDISISTCRDVKIEPSCNGCRKMDICKALSEFKGEK